MIYDLNLTAVNQGFEAAAEPGLDARPAVNTGMQQNILVSMLSTVVVDNKYTYKR